MTALASRVYLDYSATTPADPRALKKLCRFYSQRLGNPTSRDHAFGWDAAEAVDVTNFFAIVLLPQLAS